MCVNVFFVYCVDWNFNGQGSDLSYRLDIACIKLYAKPIVIEVTVINSSGKNINKTHIQFSLTK